MKNVPKLPPREGERYLRHSTEQTDDVQIFGITDDNFDPTAVRVSGEMRYQEIAGYRVLQEAKEGGFSFVVMRVEGAKLTPLTRNAVRILPEGLELHTTMLISMPRDEAYTLSDLEQCVALAIAQEASAHSGDCC
jgi:hypothetical protein